MALPCRNEEENVVPMTEAIIEQFEKHLPQYDYTIQFIDNRSSDKTREKLRQLCEQYPQVRAIFNVANFVTSTFYGVLQSDGDCCICLASDFQEPPELIPTFVKEWEQGAKVVCGIKTGSKENPVMWGVRSLYYSLISKFSSIKQIHHFTGFGLYDKDFVAILREIKDPVPSFRGLVAEYGYQMKQVEYVQQARRAGKTNNSFMRLFDLAMFNLTAYTNIGPRIATFGGLFIGTGSVVAGLVYLVLKLIYWDRFVAGMAPMLIGMFFLGAVQLFFIGLLGEYMVVVNRRVMRRPLVVEEERINFPMKEKAAANEGDEEDPG
ncbi:MAG: glycosyltransferase family 2 protein [Oscillospiraceae bacterium]